MTLFGFCPHCGYPWYCMCSVCEKSAPKYVEAWDKDDSIPDGLTCPGCGQSYNYDELAEFCENQNNMLEAMKKMCDGCMECCDVCSIAKFTKPEEWFGDELSHARLKGVPKTCRTCDLVLCMFAHPEEEMDVPRDCDGWTPIDQHKLRHARELRAKYEREGRFEHDDCPEEARK